MTPSAYDTFSADTGDKAKRDSIVEIFSRRLPWLVGLMALQSVSVFVVQRYQLLISDHIMISTFLTMVVGGGGNASAQVVGELLKSIASGSQEEKIWRAIGREMLVAIMLAGALFLAVLVRTALPTDSTSNMDALAITVSYCITVLVAVFLGATVTLGMHKCGASVNMIASGSPPTVQVLVDIIGVAVTCNVCALMLPAVTRSSKDECMDTCAQTCSDGVPLATAAAAVALPSWGVPIWLHP
jgi:Mg/Co/Ni transporter MgtE